MTLVSKQRDGAKVKRCYDQATTPYQRVLHSSDVSEEAKQRLIQEYRSLNPAALLRQIEAAQDTLWRLANHPAPDDDLSEFLSRLPGASQLLK